MNWTHGKILQAVLIAAGIALCQRQAVLAAPPLIYMDKAEATPDMGQRGDSGFLPFEGEGYCAPAAVSNGLMWLSENGFPGLVEDCGAREITHLRLASLLGGARYMDTDPRKGTGPAKVLGGLRRYLADRGFEKATIQYQGWRSHPKFSHTGTVYPDMAWIKEGLVGRSAVWLNIGWYSYDSRSATYARIGGHWVTLVGYGADRDGNQDPAMLAILDPALRKEVRGSEPIYVRARRIAAPPSGPEPMVSAGPSVGYMDRMAGWEDKAAVGEEAVAMKAAGFLKLTGEIKKANRADFALVDGVVVLRPDQDRRRGDLR